MKRLLVIFVLVGGSVFGAAFAVSTSARIAVIWAVGGGATSAVAVGVRRSIAPDGTVIDYTDDEVTFTKPDGTVYGPYGKT